MPIGLSDDLMKASPDPTKPSGQAFAITPNDSADLAQPVRSIWVGTAGDLAVIAAHDTAAVTLKNIPSGTKIDGYYIRRVNATATTATDLVGWR